MGIRTGRWIIALGLASAAALLPAAPAKPLARTPVKTPVKTLAKTLDLKSAAALVLDLKTGELLYEKRPERIKSIASITKLATAMVVLDAHLDLDEPITIAQEDVDTLKSTRSRLAVGTELTRGQAMHLALMSSENRAAHALGRTYPQGLTAFLEAMNAKAQALGLKETRFVDPTGLSEENVSSARDLAELVQVAFSYPTIREFTTSDEAIITAKGRPIVFHNSNRLVRSPNWEIGLSKTGFISEAGRCLVMQAWVAQRSVVIVLLDSVGKLTRFGDANRIRTWMEDTIPGSPRKH
jgi:D-alanyl-D-alanine endopeptidase (penicillin-binding protein 7)